MPLRARQLYSQDGRCDAPVRGAVPGSVIEEASLEAFRDATWRRSVFAFGVDDEDPSRRDGDVIDVAARAAHPAVDAMADRPASQGRRQPAAGRMLWLMRNRLSGSYRRLIWESRASFVGP